MTQVLGIDIGGSGIKGAPVDTDTGECLAERFRIPTPDPAEPQPMAVAVAQIAKEFQWTGPIGVGFPSVVRGGRVLTAANIDESWIGMDIDTLLTGVTGCPTRTINDADAAGLAEMKFGAGRGRKGTVIMLTLGTGIGSAIFTNGHLVPNTEFGHLIIDGKDAEHRASDAARQTKEMSWKKYGNRLGEFLDEMEKLFSPNLFIIGGGISKESEKFFPYLQLEAQIVPAELLNMAGIVGAALAVCEE